MQSYPIQELGMQNLERAILSCRQKIQWFCLPWYQ